MALWRMVVRISHSSLGGTGTNTWHLREMSTPPFNLENSAALSEIVQGFYDDVLPVIIDGAVISFDGVWSGVGPNEGNSIELDPWSMVGTGEGYPLPPMVSLVVGWRALSGGRQGRGRTFLGPVASANNQDDGTPTESILTASRDAAAALVSASLADGNGAVGIWSPTGNTFRDVASSKIRNVFGSLRSRRD